MSGHLIRVHETGDGWRSYLVECQESEGAACRRWCIEPGCTREDGLPHRDRDGVYDDPATETQHPEGDVGHCLRATWLNCYDLDDTNADGFSLSALRDGVSIDVYWDGDSYVWSLTEAAA